MSSYKTNHPPVMEVWKAINREYAAFKKDAVAFFKPYGNGKVCLSNGFTHIKCSGYIFSEANDSPFWTKPDRNHRFQFPRSRVTGVSAEQRVQHRDLLAKWSALSSRRIDIDPLYQSFGSDWGNLFFSGIGYFEGADGFLYVETNAQLGNWMQSIPDWEYAKAKEEKGGAA